MKQCSGLWKMCEERSQEEHCEREGEVSRLALARLRRRFATHQIISRIRSTLCAHPSDTLNQPITLLTCDVVQVQRFERALLLRQASTTRVRNGPTGTVRSS